MVLLPWHTEAIWWQGIPILSWLQQVYENTLGSLLTLKLRKIRELVQIFFCYSWTGVSISNLSSSQFFSSESVSSWDQSLILYPNLSKRWIRSHPHSDTRWDIQSVAHFPSIFNMLTHGSVTCADVGKSYHNFWQLVLLHTIIQSFDSGMEI